MRIPRYVSLPFICCACAFSAKAQSLQAGFHSPPDSVKPSIYWYWMSDNISKDGVVKDLKAMAKVGIGRAFIGNIGMDKAETPYGKVRIFSKEWWDITQEAIRTAGKEGVDIGLFNSPGWSQSGGPWIKDEQAMRYLTASLRRISGPQQFSGRIDPPAGALQDVALLAFPVPAADTDEIAAHNPAVQANVTISALPAVADKDLSTAAFLPAGQQQITIDLEVKNNFTARSLVIYPAPSPFAAQCELQVYNGKAYTTIQSFAIDRSNPNNNVGFMPYGPVGISFPATTGKQFRLVFTGIKGKAGLAEIQLNTAPRVEHYIEKQLGKMFQTPLPLWKEYQWRQAPEPDELSLMIDPAKVVDLTAYLKKDGTLSWKVPAGNWIVMRYAMAATGVHNAPAVPEGTGPEVDKMNKTALAAHFKAFVGKIQESMPAADRTALKYVVADSYETGSQNWTDDMSSAFKKQYGYDPLPWLPVLSGRVVGSADQSDRFLWDLRRLVADRVAYDYVGGLREISHQHGLRTWLENYGHWGFPGEFLQYGGQSDEIGGEFWNEGELGSIENKAASSAAHIYGKTKVSAESFTAGGLPYQRYPALLKKRGDWSFTEGINNTLLHVYIEQPYEDRNPGVNAGFGTEFNRKNTWFFMGKAFIDYIRRCNLLLQQGKPVNDVAYFIGEDAPKMTGTRDPALPAGYGFDYINAEVIETRLQVKDGRLVLPDGMEYRVLVLPKLTTMRPALLRKLKTLIAAGAVVLGPAPERSPSMQDYPAADAEVKKLAKEIWGNVDGHTIKSGSYGKGMILSGMSIPEVMALLKTVPDFNLQTDAPVLYTHRTTADEEIYFVTNQDAPQVNIAPAFRVTGLQPEWWDPVTGTCRALPEYTQQDGTTTVPLKLDAFQSGFIIFRKNKITTAAKKNFPEPQVLQQLQGPWAVQFDPAMRGPASPQQWTTLQDWSKNKNEAIRDYSGKAVYTTVLKVKTLPKDQRIYLHLGEVKVIATVKINGVDAGTAWTAPWQVDVTNLLNAGDNKVEITVANTWVNRLIGDARLPAEQRGTWTSSPLYKADSHYEPAGLLGPVTLHTIAY
ncbi:glycosyl hydrolase [Chitinophaga sp. MM2321]|uniref:glycosyl hydrolase n=1 Tax=Chitinophaga sp. MM2321 TaxID=3137178 RepID=UPI0032D5790E